MSAVTTDWQQLDTRVFSANTRRAANGELEVAGVSATDLLAQFGSPLYVIDEMDARTRAAETRAAFTSEFERIGTGAKVYYASKAFLCIEVAKWMSELGLGIDVATGGELAVALAAKVDPATIGFHGNNKSDDEIERAVSVGVGSIILDSAEEVDRVANIAEQLGRVQAVFLRVNSGVHAYTHDFLATSHEDQKFGVTMVDAPAIVARIREYASLSFLGVHCHIGSQIFNTAAFQESAQRLLALTAELRQHGEVKHLNLGGGFGIAYTGDDQPTPMSQIAAELAEIVRETAQSLNTELPIVSFEPGRFIIGPSGLTLYTVGSVKPVELSEGTTRTYVSVDGGMSDNIRTALYGAEYTARLANRVSSAEPTLVRIVGKHCESGDIVVNAEQLPSDVHRGDTVAVAATGAYCWSLSSNYNYLGRPPVVAVRDGAARLIVRGETEADLLARNVDGSVS